MAKTKTYTAKITDKEQRFEATGFVLGFLYLGDLGAYPARKIKADTKEELLNKATDMLADGSLDSGMGFESLKGAMIDIKTIEIIKIDGKDYENENTEPVFIGELESEDMEFLERCYFSAY